MTAKIITFPKQNNTKFNRYTIYQLLNTVYHALSQVDKKLYPEIEGIMSSIEFNRDYILELLAEESNRKGEKI